MPAAMAHRRARKVFDGSRSEARPSERAYAGTSDRSAAPVGRLAVEIIANAQKEQKIHPYFVNIDAHFANEFCTIAPL